MKQLDHYTLERLAAQLCEQNGGKWDRKRTKKNVWRAHVVRVLAILEARPRA